MNFLHTIKSIPELQATWKKIESEYSEIPSPGVRWLCRNDLYYLMVKVCRRTDMIHPWVLDRCREVEANPNGFLDLWAREHFKSSLITFGKTLQDILIDPEITVGIFSENSTLAGKFLTQIKEELQSNKILKENFPDILYDNPEKEAPIWSREAIIVKRQRKNPLKRGSKFYQRKVYGRL